MRIVNLILYIFLLKFAFIQKRINLEISQFFFLQPLGNIQNHAKKILVTYLILI
jgi:hypothetical protein